MLLECGELKETIASFSSEAAKQKVRGNFYIYTEVIHYIGLSDGINYICTAIALTDHDTPMIKQDSDGFSKVSFHNIIFMIQSILSI